eukprot:GHVT01095917.1.p1 GENE.GHVT01095917.1~~GHVT01095917.1.p1  ORF type:complete len:972 (+),score=83.16 GHVT01095917.1:347-3262(+)
MTGTPTGRSRTTRVADVPAKAAVINSSTSIANVGPAAVPRVGRATPVAAGIPFRPRGGLQATHSTGGQAAGGVVAVGVRKSARSNAGVVASAGKSATTNTNATAGRKRARSAVRPRGAHGSSSSCSPLGSKKGTAFANRSVTSAKAARTNTGTIASSPRNAEARGKSGGDSGVLVGSNFAVSPEALCNPSVGVCGSGSFSPLGGQSHIGQSEFPFLENNDGLDEESQPAESLSFPLSSVQFSTSDNTHEALIARIHGIRSPSAACVSCPFGLSGAAASAPIGTPPHSRHSSRAAGEGDDLDTSPGESPAHRGRSACTPVRSTPVHNHTPLHELKRAEAGPTPLRSSSPFSTAKAPSHLNTPIAASPARLSPVSGIAVPAPRGPVRESRTVSPFKEKDDETSEWPASLNMKFNINPLAEEAFDIPDSALSLPLSTACNNLRDDFRLLTETLHECRRRNQAPGLNTVLPKMTGVSRDSILRILWMAPTIYTAEWTRDTTRSDSPMKQLDIVLNSAKNPRTTSPFAVGEKPRKEVEQLFHKILIGYTAEFHQDFVASHLGISPYDYTVHKQCLPRILTLSKWLHQFDPNKIRGCTQLPLWKIPPHKSLRKASHSPIRMNSGSPCSTQEPMGRAGRAPASALKSPGFGSPRTSSIGEYCGTEPVVDCKSESPRRGRDSSPKAARQSNGHEGVGTTLRSAAHRGSAIRERAPSTRHLDEAAASGSGGERTSCIAVEDMSAAENKSPMIHPPERDDTNAVLPTLLHQRGLAKNTHKPPNIRTADSSSLQKLHAHNIHPHRHRHDPADEPASPLQKGRRRVSAFPVEQNDSIVAHQQARQCRSLSPFRTARNGGDSRPLDAEVSNPESARGLVVKHVLMHLLHDELKNSTSPKSFPLEFFWQKHLENDKRHISLSECNKAMSEMMNRFPQAVKIEQCITNSAKNRVTCFPGVHFVKAVGQIAEEARSGNPMSNLSTRS